MKIVFANILGLIFFSAVTSVYASGVLEDTLEYDGVVANAWTSGATLDFPYNDTVWRFSREDDRCSVIGSPRARWKISEGRLWLIGLLRCSSPVSLHDAYGVSDEQVFADWITSDISTSRGKLLCRFSFRGGITERTLTFTIVRGVLVRVAEKDNADNPRIVDFDKYLSEADKGSMKGMIGPCN